MGPLIDTTPAADGGTLFGGADQDNYLQGIESMGQLIVQRLTGHAQRILLTDASTGQQLTGAALRDRGIRVAECLRSLGVRRGDTVALCTENRVEFADVAIGAFLLGATLTPINPAYTVRELLHAVQLSRPRVVFGELATAGAFARVAAECACVERRFVFADNSVAPAATGSRAATNDELLPSGAEWFDEWLRSANVPPVRDGSAYACPINDMATTVGLVLYSSGTTGLPKGVQLAQLSSMLALFRHRQRDNSDERAVVPEPTILSIVPFFHTYGCHVLIMTLLFGDHVVTLPRFEPVAFLRAISRYRCTSLYVAPPLLVFLAKSPLVDQHDISSVRSIFSGAAPLTAELERAVSERLHQPFIRQGYGMTEGTVAFTVQTRRCHAQGSVGELVAGVHGRVVDADSGRVLGAGEEGELQFRGCAMLGYVGNAAATAETFTADGWLRTGDIGYYTAAGEWFVVDRLKELIKYKGFQVAPAELEGLLLQMPEVADCGVIGVPDERAGELPLAFVVAAAPVEAEAVQRFVRERVAPSKWLSGGVRFVREIPKNPSGKILRRELRALAKRLAEAGEVPAVRSKL